MTDQTDYVDTISDADILKHLDASKRCRCETCIALRAANALPTDIAGARRFLKRYNFEKNLVNEGSTQ